MFLLSELKRRNVLRVAAAYVAVAWLLVQVVETVAPAFGIGGWLVRYLVTGLAVGLVPVLAMSWAFEWTPEGLKRDRDVDPADSIAPRTARRLDRVFLAALSLALAYFALDKFLFDPARDDAREQEVARKARSEALIESYGDKSIAVLPFVNMSADPEQGFFSDGVSEELLNLLAQIPELRVISRSSAFAYKGKDVTVPQLAELLNVGHVLEGSVRRSGDRVRITAQLIEARSDTHLWSQTYDRDLHDVFAIQDEIAAEVVTQLKVALLGEVPTSRRTDPEAYALLLKARELLDQWGDHAVVYQSLQRAVAIDPNYVPALTTLAWFYYRVSRHRDEIENGAALPAWSDADLLRLEAEALDTALELEPGDPVALSHRAVIQGEAQGDWQATARTIDEALRAGPNNPDLLRLGVWFGRLIDRPNAAVAIGEFAVARDPLCVMCRYHLGSAYLEAGRPDAAESTFRVLMSIDVPTGGLVARALFLQGEPQAALEFIESIGPVDGSWGLQARVLALHAQGQPAEAHQALTELARAIDAANVNDLLLLAQAQAALADVDPAFATLERWLALQPTDDVGNVIALRNPLFANLHADPRWAVTLGRYRLAPVQTDAIEFDIDYLQ